MLIDCENIGYTWHVISRATGFGSLDGPKNCTNVKIARERDLACALTTDKVNYNYTDPKAQSLTDALM